MAVPCLLLGGENDPYHAGDEACSKRMPNAVFVSLPGLEHREAFFRADLVLPHVLRFPAQVGQHSELERWAGCDRRQEHVSHPL